MVLVFKAIIPLWNIWTTKSLHNYSQQTRFAHKYVTSILLSCKLESKGISAHVASCLYGWYISIGLGGTEGSTMWLVQERYGDYYQDVALEYLRTTTNRASIANILRHEKMQWHLIWNSIGISQQLSVIVVGTNLISTLECCALCGNIVCTALHVAQIFDGGWILDIFQLDRQKLTCHFLEVLQLYGER